MKTFNKNSQSSAQSNSRRTRRRVLSVTQILARIRKQKKRKFDQRQKPVKPIINFAHK